MKRIAGLDIHSKSTSYCIQDKAGGRIVAEGEISTTVDELEALVVKYKLKGCRVGLETGTMSIFVASALETIGVEPVIIDAAEVRKKARSKRQKSDRRDAFEICDGLRRDIYVCTVKIPDASVLHLRQLLSTRRHFVRLKTTQVNAIKALLRRAGLATLYRQMRKEAAFERLKKQPQVSAQIKALIEHHQSVWKAADEQSKLLDKQLEKFAKRAGKPVLKLQQIPGVGPVVALTVFAFLSDAERFESAKRAASYSGLVPQTYNSGERERHSHFTKRGPRELRAMLVEAAQHARKAHHPLHATWKKLSRKKGPKVATVAVAHRLVRISYAMLRDGSDFDPTKLVLEKDDKWSQLAAA